MDKSRFLEVFVEEANEIIEKLSVDILNFEQSPSDLDCFNEIYRGIHTLKGNANSFGFIRLGKYVHLFEDLLSFFRSDLRRLQATHIDLLFAAIEMTKELLAIELDKIEKLPAHYDEMMQSFQKILDQEEHTHEIKIESQSTEVVEQKDLSLEFKTLDELEELPIQKPQNMKTREDTKSLLKIDSQKLDELFDSIGELIIAQNFLEEAQEIYSIKNKRIQDTLSHLFKTTKLIQDRVMSLRMIPIDEICGRVRLVARDTSKQLNKELNFIIEGAETEIDKSMVDILFKPLSHLLRNAIDHGLEDTSTRKMIGKEPKGSVIMRAFHKGGTVVIEIQDDGSGIDKEHIRDKAIAKGLIDHEMLLSEAEIYQLLLKPGFSTSQTITDISGRGVGLDVVKSAIEKLQGRVEIDSTLNVGSTFRIVLPLTLAIIDAMVVISANERFLIPTLSVLESFYPKKEMIHIFQNSGEFVDLRGEMLPIVRLNQLLDIDCTVSNAWEATLICIETQKGKFALLVDEVINRQQVVIKPLGEILSKVRVVSGSAIMGDGEVALILNPEELYRPVGVENAN